MLHGNWKSWIPRHTTCFWCETASRARWCKTRRSQWLKWGREGSSFFFVLLVSFANISNQSHHFCWKYWDIGFVVHVVNASYAYRLMYTTWRNHKLTSMIYCNDDIWRLFLWLRVRARSSCTGSRVSSYFQDVGKIRISQKNGAPSKTPVGKGLISIVNQEAKPI